MGGKFINTDQKTMVNSMVENFVDNVLKNPVYTYNQYRPTIATYFNINNEKSTLDKSMLIEYSTTGKDSPIYYNRINGMFLYGFQRIDLNMDIGEFGEEADEITGETLIMPNTIEPTPGDHFIVDYIKEPLLFKVIDVQFDTLDNGSNVYKLTYKVTSTNHEKIEMNVVDDYEFLIENVGTNQKAVIKKTSYNKLEIIDDILSKLRKYYKDLFFNNRVQTFTFTFRGNNFYDAYMVQFLKSTDILNTSTTGRDGYVYISHNTKLPKTFSMEYDNSIFKAIELCNKDILSGSNTYPIGNCIEDTSTIFYRRYERYFSLDYKRAEYDPPEGFNYKINTLSDDLLINIKNNTLTDSNVYDNIIIKYFNNNKDLSNEIELLKLSCTFDNSKDSFYIIPLVIYCLEYTAKGLLS